MTSVASTPPPTAPTAPAPPAARALERLAGWLDRYAQTAMRIARTATVAGAALAAGVLGFNVFTRYVLGYSIFGSEELARFAFIWTIWLGVALAVRSGAAVAITILVGHGPAWWRRSLRTFSGAALAVLLIFACYRATQFAMAPVSLSDTSPALDVRRYYGVAPMALGLYFITLFYVQQAVAGAARLVAAGREGMRIVAQGVAGGLVAAVLVWAGAYGLLQSGASKLVALGLIFVALTLAGTPVVFMLLMVGLIATVDIFGLHFYPNPDVLFPWRTIEDSLGLSTGSELLVILMFLVVAEVMNASGMSDRLIRFAAACVGHLRGGMAYVCQLTSALASGISGSAQADAAVMTPLLVPAMEKEGYPREVAAAVVAGASIKGPIGPISIMFIVYGVVVQGPAGASIKKLLLSGVFAEILLLLFQGATVYLVVRRMGFFQKRPFAGMRTVARTALDALPVLAIPVIILGGILGGVFTPTESGAVAAIVVVGLALFWYGSLAPRELPGVIAAAGLETGIVMLLIGTSSVLANVLFIEDFGSSLASFFDFTSDKYVFLLVVNLLLLAVGIFIEPLPALYILAPLLAPIAVGVYGVDPTHFGLIMVFNLVLALIHPPIGLVLFLVSSIAKVPIERLSIMILPWLGVSLVVLFLVTYLPSQVVLALPHLLT
jgi:tripartite ATP-independent transporter DctM subunit